MPKAKVKAAVAEKPLVSVKPERKGRYFYANGKRKRAIARVRLYADGKGEMMVNEKPVTEYFFGSLIGTIKAPLKLTSTTGQFDMVAHVIGGGVSGQADALRHAVSKALLEYDPALRTELKKAGFLTRDARIKERKKFGLRRARRAPQWSKR